jgi:signal peptidase II
MPVRYRIFSIVAILGLVADQLTKMWARGNLAPGKPQAWFSLWSWDLSFNPGSAFGLFSSQAGARWALTIVGIVAAIAILVMLAKRNDGERWLAAALGLVFSGALGNVIDRLLYGKVTDFISWHVGTTKWPTFNVADAALVIGVVLLFFVMPSEKSKKEKKLVKET